MNRTIVIALGSLLLASGAPAESCGGGKDASPDGRIPFTRTGNVTYDKTIRAHNMPRGGAGCRWRVETEPLKGLKKGAKPRVVAKGDGGNAKINIARPDTVKVYLVTNGCGTWR